jgi:hypothetical protein
VPRLSPAGADQYSCARGLGFLVCGTVAETAAIDFLRLKTRIEKFWILALRLQESRRELWGGKP